MSLTCRHIAFDTETTGFRDPRVVEVAAVEFHPETGAVIDRYHTYVNPAPARVEPVAGRVHGLHNSFLAKHPPFPKIAGSLRAFLAGAALYGHNAVFDRRVLDLEFDLVGYPVLTDIARRVVCTLEQAKKRLPELPGRKLNHLCDHYGIDRSRRQRHGALLDCELLVEVIVRLRKEPLPEPPAPAASPRLTTGARAGAPGWCAGGPWYADEIAALIAAYAAGQAFSAIAKTHHRSVGAVVMQLQRQGRISTEEAQRHLPRFAATLQQQRA